MAKKNPQTEKRMTMARSMAEQAKNYGPNPANRIETAWHPGTPPRPEGCFEPGRNVTQRRFNQWRPTGSRPGENAKKV